MKTVPVKWIHKLFDRRVEKYITAYQLGFESLEVTFNFPQKANIRICIVKIQRHILNWKVVIDLWIDGVQVFRNVNPANLSWKADLFQFWDRRMTNEQPISSLQCEHPLDKTLEGLVWTCPTNIGSSLDRSNTGG